MTMKKIIALCFLPWIIIILIIAGYIVSIAIHYHHADQVNAQRLKTLQSDGLLTCSLAPIAPANGNTDACGSNHGIGFGGTSPTIVTRYFDLNGVDPDSAIVAFARCAQAGGWVVTSREEFKKQEIYLRGRKTCPGGWRADMFIALGWRPFAPANSPPVVQIQLDAEVY